MNWGKLFLQALRQLNQQLESRWDEFADGVPAWHLAIEHLKKAELEQLDLAELITVPESRGSNSVAEGLEQAVSSLLIWAQTACGRATKTQGILSPNSCSESN